jgi:hypothetical protein
MSGHDHDEWISRAFSAAVAESGMGRAGTKLRFPRKFSQNISVRLLRVGIDD